MRKRRTITRKRKTKTKTEKASSKDLNFCAEIWDNMKEAHGDQVLYELGVEYEIIENQDYIKPRTSSSGFWSMLPKYRKLIFDDYKRFELGYVSETFADIIRQAKNPYDMTQTKVWWNGMTEDDREEVLYGVEKYDHDIEVFHKWDFIDQENQIFIHQLRMAGDFDYIPLPKSDGEFYVREHGIKSIKLKEREPNLVTCWHCGNDKQKILSMTEVFECDKCKEDLWTGDGGYVEQVGSGMYA